MISSHLRLAATPHIAMYFLQPHSMLLLITSIVRRPAAHPAPAVCFSTYSLNTISHEASALPPTTTCAVPICCPRKARCANRLRHVEHNLRARPHSGTRDPASRRAARSPRRPSMTAIFPAAIVGPEHARAIVWVSKAGVHQPRRLIKPVRTIQHHADQLHPVPARAEDQTAPARLVNPVLTPVARRGRFPAAVSCL